MFRYGENGHLSEHTLIGLAITGITIIVYRRKKLVLNFVEFLHFRWGNFNEKENMILRNRNRKKDQDFDR